MYFCFVNCVMFVYFCFDWCELCEVAQIVIKRFAHISISVLTGVNCVIKRFAHISNWCELCDQKVYVFLF